MWCPHRDSLSSRIGAMVKIRSTHNHLMLSLLPRNCHGSNSRQECDCYLSPFGYASKIGSMKVGVKHPLFFLLNLPPIHRGDTTFIKTHKEINWWFLLGFGLVELLVKLIHLGSILVVRFSSIFSPLCYTLYIVVHFFY